MVSASAALRRASSEASASWRHGAQQPRRRPGAQRGFDLLLAGEMHRRRAAHHGELDRIAAVHRKPHLVQLGDLADRGGDDRRRRGAAGARLAEFGFDRAGLAGEGGIDHAVERQRGSVRHHRHARRRVRRVACPRRRARACGPRCARRAGRRRSTRSARRARRARSSVWPRASPRRSAAPGRARCRRNRAAPPRPSPFRTARAAARSCADRRPR